MNEMWAYNHIRCLGGTGWIVYNEAGLAMQLLYSRAEAIAYLVRYARRNGL